MMEKMEIWNTFGMVYTSILANQRAILKHNRALKSLNKSGILLGIANLGLLYMVYELDKRVKNLENQCEKAE